MLAYSPSLLNRLAAEKQLFAKACPCTVDKVEPISDIHFIVLHTILLDTPEEYVNNLVYNIEYSHTSLDLYRSNYNNYPARIAISVELPLAATAEGRSNQRTADDRE
jgi:hypothetical protein